MPRITAIESQPRRHRCSLYVDGRFFCGVDREVVARLRLQPEQEVKPEDLQRIVEREEEVRARELCLRWLEAAPRSRRELARRLRQRGVEEPVAERVLERLQAAGLIDDEALARSMIRSRTATGGFGRRRMSAELAQRGVSRDVAARTLADEFPGSESESCLAAAQSKARVYAHLPRAIGRRRLLGFLCRRGFSTEDARQAVNRVLPDNSDESDSESSVWRRE